MEHTESPQTQGTWFRAGLAEIVRREHEQVYSVVVSGEVDISNVQELRAATMEIPNDALGLVVDLSSVTFLDSSTARLLFDLQQGLPRRGQVLRVVCAPGSAPARALQLMAFDERLLTAASADEAIQMVRHEVPLPE